jgi:hypothetical protein
VEIAQQFPSIGHRLADLRANGIPYKRQPEHGDFLYMDEVTILNAPGGVGKSTLLVSTAVSLASGLPLLGQKIFKRRRVLLINLEEHIDELILKFDAALSYHGRSNNLPADIDDWITLYGSGEMPGLTLTTTAPGSSRELVNQAGLQRLHASIRAAEADVVIIDPLSMLMPAGMNDNGVVYAAIQGVKQIAADLGCGIVLAAHTRKGGTIEGDGAEATLGAVALTNAARIVKGLRRLSPETCRAIGVPYGDEGDIREIVDQKANYTPLGSGQYIRIVGVPMNNAQPPDYPDEDWVGVATAFTPQPGGRSLPSAAMRDVLLTLAAGINGEPYGPAKQSKDRYYGDDVARAVSHHLPGANPRKLADAAKDAVEEVITKGWAEIFDWTAPNRHKRKGLRVIVAATPWATDPVMVGPYAV